MNVTRDVILDLLPLCHAGEASDDTRNLVAAFAAQHPEIARLLATPPAAKLPDTPYDLNKENEMETLEKTKTYLKWRTILLGSSIFLTLFAVVVMALIPAALFLFQPGDNPRLMVLALVGVLVVGLMAAAAWTGYFTFRNVYRVDLGQGT